MKKFALVAGAAALVSAQQVGKVTQEQHPQLSVQECTKSGGCQTQQKSVVIDANWRWVNPVGTYKNCYKGNTWNATACPDPQTCAKNCALEGAGKEYVNTYGVHAQGSSLKLDFVTNGQYSKNVGSRVYLLEDETHYKMFQLKNKEFTFDVDLSELPCGLNGALYFVGMDEDGGMARFPSNKAGAKYGTGYCDAQCPHDMKFIHGEANSEGWKPANNSKSTGTGKYGSCCTEFDVWEANTQGMAYTAHSCNVSESFKCEGTSCGDNGADRYSGVCDKNGCDFQTYRLGDKKFYGNGTDFAVNSAKKMTVVTQFITHDGTDSGDLTEVRRHYVQDGQVIQTPTLKVGGSESYNSLSTDYCKAEVAWFKDGTNFLEKGGMEETGAAFEKGMVLALSLWDDHYANMLWLDSTYPTDSSAPGAARGPCSTSSGDANKLETDAASASVTYSNIKFGEIGSTAQ